MNIGTWTDDGQKADLDARAMATTTVAIMGKKRRRSATRYTVVDGSIPSVYDRLEADTEVDP